MAGKKRLEKEKCKYTVGDYKCSRDALPGDEHCIFHSEDIEGKKEKFNDAFWMEFERQKKQEKNYDFTGFVFPAKISFWGEFDKTTTFMDAHFIETVSFWGSEFPYEADFMLTKFSEEADFNGAKFYGRAFFRATQFYGGYNFEDAQFSNYTDFDGAIFYGEANFYKSTFLGYELTGLFSALRNRGFKRIKEGKYKIKDFRFHLSEKIARAYPVIDRMTKDAWYLDDFKANHPIIYWIWWLLADCGRSFFRWAFLSLIFVLYFAGNFWLIDYANPAAFYFDPAIQDRSLWSFIYYSIVTFTTLGFGDIIPTLAWVQRWVMAEVIMGYIMLGGLISILANKLARRS